MQTNSPGLTVSSISASAKVSSGPERNTFETPSSSITGLVTGAGAGMVIAVVISIRP